MKLQQKAQFFNQLAALLKAGIPLQQSLKMAAPKNNPAFKNYLQKVSQTVGKGEDLATALAISNRYFDKFTINLIKAGAASGALTETCQRLAEDALKQQSWRKNYNSIYWAIITTTFSLFLLTLAILVKLGLLLPGLIVICLLITALLFNYRKILPKLPLAGKILEARLMLNFSELSLPLSCGVPIVTALDLVRGLCASSRDFASQEMAVDLKRARQQVKKGATLSESLQGKLPPVAMQAVVTGEETGRLDRALEKLAEYYQRELAENLVKLKGMLVPVSILAMGGVVGLLGYGAIATLINSLPD